jgi:alpha-tubulin suppressor-like RCC1 family protein
MPLEVTTNFKDSNGVDLGTKLVTKDYLISVYSSIGQKIGLTPELWVWGNNLMGQLGVNYTNPSASSTPTTTSVGGSTWKQISSAISHTAAIKIDGTLWTWGNGTNGRLGNAFQSSSNTPITTFAGGTNWKQVSCGLDYTAAVKTDGTLWTWGNGGAGALGVVEDFLTRSITPITTFSGGTNWSDTATGVAEELYTISAGYRMSSAIKTDGTLWTWGTGSTGNGDSSTYDTPVTTFAGGITWKQVSTGRNQAAAIKTDGTLWIWGRNTGGALGISDTQSTAFVASTPITTFAGGTNWRQVSCGYNYSAAVKTDGTLWTWGSSPTLTTNILARIFGTSILFPVLISSTWADTATGVAEELYTFAGGKTHSAGIKTDGTLWTWGNNAYGLTASGQLGIGASSVERSTPTTTFAGGTTWKQISVGYYHTAAIKTDGTLWTWGNGGSGRLGNNLTAIRSTPVTTFAGGTNWKQVACGSQHTAAIKTDGTLWTWGSGTNGALGDATIVSKNTPVTTFAGGTTWKTVSAGFDFTAAIKTDGTLWTWGSNSNGQTGINNTTAGTKSTPVTTFAGGTTWSQVSCGLLHTAAVKTDGTLWTWGYTGSGRLGNTIITGNRSTPVTTFAGGTNWSEVSCGNNHTASVKTDGTLWTWGAGANGRLGNNLTAIRSTPVTTFAGGTNWKQVACGDTHTIALRDDGTTKELFSFGNNIRGQLGSSSANNVPGQVFSYTNNWKQVSCNATGDHISAVKTDGTLWTWGNGTNGRLGNTIITGTVSTPITTFAGGTTWKQVSSGNNHTAAVKTDGTLWTWGAGGSGRLGNASVSNRSTPVTTFAGGTNWNEVSCGYHTAAVKTDGTLWTWGFNSSGQLGTNDLVNKSTPVTTFAGGTTWNQVSSGQSHTLALSDDTVNKRLFVFGTNSYGQLGFRLSILNPVTTFAGGTNWKQVSSGWTHTAAIKIDGTLWAWGNNTSGQIGINDTVTIKTTPVTTFAGGTNWKQVSTGIEHTAAIKTDGTLWSWGNNTYRQMGNNSTTIFISTPVTTFSGGTNWKQVSCANQFTAAIKTDGTLWAWGNNSTRQIGNNSATTYISTPVTTFAGGNNWKQVSCGGGIASGRVAAIKTDGTLWTWGNNYAGSLGINSNQSAVSTPVTTFAGGTNWKQVSSSGAHVLAIKSVDII